MDNFNALELTVEQQAALDASDGVVHGTSFVLLRTENVLGYFGYAKDELVGELQPALDQVENGEVAEWNLEEFLAKMHSQHAAKLE